MPSVPTACASKVSMRSTLCVYLDQSGDVNLSSLLQVDRVALFVKAVVGMPTNGAKLFLLRVSLSDSFTSFTLYGSTISNCRCPATLTLRHNSALTYCSMASLILPFRATINLEIVGSVGFLDTVRMESSWSGQVIVMISVANG